MNIEIELKYVECKINEKELINYVVEMIRNFGYRNLRVEDFQLISNEELGVCEISYIKQKDVIIEYNNNFKTEKVNIKDSIRLTNLILEEVFNIEEGKGCIQYYNDFFEEMKYYYVLMPYKAFQGYNCKNNIENTFNKSNS